MEQRFYLSLFLPLWSIELAQMRLMDECRTNNSIEETSRKTLLLTSEKAGKEIVVRCCPKAKRLGVSTGMNLSNAKALTENYCCHPFDPEHEREVLKALACWAIKFSPVVAIDSLPAGYLPVGQLPAGQIPGKTAAEISRSGDPRFSGLLIDVTGEEKLFSGYDNLIKKISSELAAFGFCSRIAIAPSYGGAWALARYAQKSSYIINNKTALRSALSALPVSSLRLSKQTLKSLLEVNISRIEHLYQIPFSRLSERFDYELINRLDEALGKKEESFNSVTLGQTEVRKRTFSGPQTSLKALTCSVEKLSKEAILVLKEKQQKIVVLSIEVKAQQAPVSRKDFSLTSGTLDIEHIKRVTTPWLEKIQMGEGITEVTVEVKKTDLVDASYQQLFHISRSSQRNLNTGSLKDLSELIDNLVYALGSKNIRELVCKESFIPEQQFSFNEYRSQSSSQAIKADAARSKILKAERPSKLFERPQPASAIALLPDKPPSSLTWKNQTYRISQGIGPERISSEWWKYYQTGHEAANQGDNQNISERDYFKVQVPSGLWLWIYREVNNSRWFVHGIWN